MTNADYALARTKSEDASTNLEALEQEPIPDANWDECRIDPDGIQHISDDVNALSMSVGRQSSYLGVSSIAAALRVITKITTALESVIISTPQRTAHPTRNNSPGRHVSETPSSIAQPALSAEAMIDNYFAQIHPLIPMVDETRFRRIFHANDRKDSSWLALVNIVYAMGTIAASSADDNSHLMFYSRAKEYMNLDTFGDGHIEALQALGIMGGYYLHYENRPNMASGIMGAAMRMACALGLHREYTEQACESKASQIRQALLIPREVRRRTWWSLFCLDTWASTTTGRPSLGRISAGVTVQPPESLAASPTSSNRMSDEDVSVMVLCQEIAFCKIATLVQDRLAEQPLLPFEETVRLDAELKHWYSNMPAMMRYPNRCPDRARVPRAVVSWRYHNLRVVLHRPVLLNNALRSSLENTDEYSDDEIRLVEACRVIAGEAIADIQNQWVPNQLSGWNATWLLFQASMVPLVTLFAEYNRGNLDAINVAQEQTEAVIQQLEKMERWSLTAKRSKDVVSKIYERNRAMVIQARQAIAANQGQSQAQAQSQASVRPQAQARGRGQQTHQQPRFYAQQPQALLHGMPMQTQQSFVQNQQMFPQQLDPSGLQMGVSGMFQSGMVPPQPGGLAGHMGMHDSTMGSAGEISGPPTFMNEDELNAFWNQIMWGEGEMPGFVMDTGYGNVEDSSSQPFGGGF